MTPVKANTQFKTNPIFTSELFQHVFTASGGLRCWFLKWQKIAEC